MIEKLHIYGIGYYRCTVKNCRNNGFKALMDIGVLCKEHRKERDLLYLNFEKTLIKEMNIDMNKLYATMNKTEIERFNELYNTK